MITITQGPGTFQRTIVKWIEDTLNEDGSINVAAHQDRPTNPDGSPVMENCDFDGLLLQDGKNQWICDAIKAVVNGNMIDVYSNGSKLISYPNTQENLALFESYLSDGEQSIDMDKAKLRVDMQKGSQVIEAYLLDNRKINLTKEQALQQLSKFSGIEVLLRYGSIQDASDLLQKIDVDEIFTQERKDKYLGML